MKTPPARELPVYIKPVQSRDKLPLIRRPDSESFEPLARINPPPYPPPNLFASVDDGDMPPIVQLARENGTLEPGIASTLTSGEQKLPVHGKEAAINLFLKILWLKGHDT